MNQSYTLDAARGNPGLAEGSEALVFIRTLNPGAAVGQVHSAGVSKAATAGAMSCSASDGYPTETRSSIGQNRYYGGLSFMAGRHGNGETSMRLGAWTSGRRGVTQ